MRTRNNTSHWTLRLTTIYALSIFALLGCLAFNTTGLADGNDLGRSPFDFTDAVYRAQGIVPENIVLRVGDASRSGDFVIDNTNTDPNRRNIRTIETTPGTTGSSGLTYANIFGVLNSTSFERSAGGRRPDGRQYALCRRRPERRTARGPAPRESPASRPDSRCRSRGRACGDHPPWRSWPGRGAANSA